MHEAQTQRSSQLRSEDVVLGTQRELLAQEEGRRGRRRVYLAKVESAYGAASTSGARGGVAQTVFDRIFSNSVLARALPSNCF